MITDYNLAVSSTEKSANGVLTHSERAFLEPSINFIMRSDIEQDNDFAICFGIRFNSKNNPAIIAARARLQSVKFTA
jgi:hypothetical protein